jgi:hypothetical protein
MTWLSLIVLVWLSLSALVGIVIGIASRATPDQQVMEELIPARR